MKGFTVIMPTYNQCTYIRRSIQSLFSQSYKEWELIIINDGCTDETETYIQSYLSDKRVHYIKNEKNKGLGHALNQGMDNAKYDHIAYLPSDDYYYTDHLQTLSEAFEASDKRVLVYAGSDSQISDSTINMRHEISQGLFGGHCLQLVQTAHKQTAERWTSRSEFVSDDLFLLFWHKLTTKGLFHYINKVTSNWSIHLYQFHRIFSEEFDGNINYYRRYYKIEEPIKAWVSDHKFIDEEKTYKNFHKQSINAINGLKILLVGELSYHPDRIYALEEAGHHLYGLWIERPTFCLSNVGHLPFGHVEDLSFQNWEEEIRRIKPDVIYGLLNFGSIYLANEVRKKCLDIPFVWHFKEGPFVAQANGIWNELIELYSKADGAIYINQEAQAWYEQFLPPKANELTYILDGDLPKSNYFTNEFSPKLSARDGEIHTVIPGRTIGLDMESVKLLAQQKIHLHCYETNLTRKSFIGSALKIAPKYVHYHEYCSQENWTKEFSQYDAGWLHCFNSRNKGKLEQVTWDDLNMPARMSVLAAAGIPMIQKDNEEHIVATQSHLQHKGCGIFFKNYEDLTNLLHDNKQMKEWNENILRNRLSFSFDYHVDNLISFFRKVIISKHSKSADHGQR
jgi:glycosyltransferase involved in cell wall biosynthesis